MPFVVFALVACFNFVLVCRALELVAVPVHPSTMTKIITAVMMKAPTQSVAVVSLSLIALSSVVAPRRGPGGGLSRRRALWGSNAGITQNGNSAGFDDLGLKLSQSLGRAAKVRRCQRGA